MIACRGNARESHCERLLTPYAGADGKQRILRPDELGAPYSIKVYDLIDIGSHLQGDEAAAAYVESSSEFLSIRQRMGHHIFQTEKWPLFEVCTVIYGG